METLRCRYFGFQRLICPSYTRNVLLDFCPISETCHWCRNMCYLSPKKYLNLGPLRTRKVVWCTSSALLGMQHYVPGRLYEQIVNNLPKIQTTVPSFIVFFILFISQICSAAAADNAFAFCLMLPQITLTYHLILISMKLKICKFVARAHFSVCFIRCCCCVRCCCCCSCCCCCCD